MLMTIPAYSKSIPVITINLTAGPQMTSLSSKPQMPSIKRTGACLGTSMDEQVPIIDRQHAAFYATAFITTLAIDKMYNCRRSCLRGIAKTPMESYERFRSLLSGIINAGQWDKNDRALPPSSRARLAQLDNLISLDQSAEFYTSVNPSAYTYSSADYSQPDQKKRTVPLEQMALHLYYRPRIESHVGYYDIRDFDIRSLRLDLMLLERLALRTEGVSSLQIIALGLLDWAMGHSEGKERGSSEEGINGFV